MPEGLKMKNIFTYYLFLAVPLFLLMFFWEYLEPTIGLLLLPGYVFIYRTWLDGRRLYCKGLIAKNDIWTVAYNGARIKHFKALYLQQ